jgi:hypothetical protein
MADSGSKTMRQIAVESPAAIAVLEKYRLDFCGAGDKSLEAAAAEAGVPLQTILYETGSPIRARLARYGLPEARGGSARRQYQAARGRAACGERVGTTPRGIVAASLLHIAKKHGRGPGGGLLSDSRYVDAQLCGGTAISSVVRRSSPEVLRCLCGHRRRPGEKRSTSPRAPADELHENELPRRMMAPFRLHGGADPESCPAAAF